MIRRRNGYTLVELMVVMLIFVIVIMITGSVFNTLFKSSSKTSKSVETQITDIIGLEVMRFDIKHAGHGLPYFFPTPIQYNEAPNAAITVDSRPPTVNVNPSNYNDGLGSGINGNPPRPFWLGDNVGVNGSDYLVVKSTLLGSDATARKWTNVIAGGTPRNWTDTTLNLSTAGENVVVVDPAPNADPTQQRQLITSGGNFYAKYMSTLANFYPTENNQSYLIFGLADQTVAAPRMPFNRADYYIQIPAAASMPQRCAPGTGILYKSVLGQDGVFSPIPLLDCVGDVQVVFSLATNAPSDKSVSLHVANLNTLPSAYLIASQVKEVRLYVLTHEGQRDPNYTYPAGPIIVGESFDGGATNLGSTWTSNGAGGTQNLSASFANWQNYYWKVLKVVIVPTSL